MYLERVLFALIDLRMENQDRREVCLDDGFIIKREVWKGSTFAVPRARLPAWKKLIDEHRRFHRELTQAEKNIEAQQGLLVLMKPPLRRPIEGEHALWGEDADYPPDSYGREMRRVPSMHPTVPEPFQSEYKDDEDHLVEHSLGIGRAVVLAAHEGWF